MTPVEPALLDTNILVYALYQSSPHYQGSRALLDQAKQPGAGFCLTLQNLTEFYAIVTNPRRVTQPKSVDEALAAIADILALPGISLLPIPADLVTRWTQLVRQHPVTGAKVFDVQLIAIMLSNGIQKIYTFNVADFQRFSGIRVVTP